MPPPKVRTKGFLARVLDPVSSRIFSPQTPQSWYEPQPQYGPAPFGSGVGYVSSPFSSYYDKVWGVLPHPDQARYRLMYRTVPVFHAAVDKLVQIATTKWFSLHIDEDNESGPQLIDLCEKWITAHPEFRENIMVAAKDCLIHGTAFVEKCYPETQLLAVAQATEEAKQLPDYQELERGGVFGTYTRFHPAFTQGLQNATQVPRMLYDNPLIAEQNEQRIVMLMKRADDPDGRLSELVWLKNLDYLTMRVRRDAWGNIYGAIQFLAIPPVAFDTSKIVIFKWNPTSTFYENANGVSIGQALIRTQEAIWQIENDLLVIGHAFAKPPYKFRRGLIDKTTGKILATVKDEEWNAFTSRMGQRQAGSDLFLPMWVDAEPMPLPSDAIGSLINELKYHAQQRTIALRVPPQLLGVPEGSTRTTADVSQEDFILTIQTLRESLTKGIREILKAILDPHRDEFGDDFAIPEIEWNPVLESDETTELVKIVNAFGSHLITLEEARHLIRDRGIFEIKDDNPDALAELKALAAPPTLMPLMGDPSEEPETDEASPSGNGGGKPTPKPMVSGR